MTHPRPTVLTGFPCMPACSVITARWIFPVASEPIAHGAIEIGPDGRIAALHRRPSAGARDLGDVAIVPGLVNAHAHLEFSDLPEPLKPARPFPAWIRALMAYRRRRGDASAAVRQGLVESRRSGTAGIGEIVAQDCSGDRPDDVSGTVLFRELIGLPPENVDNQLEIARRFLRNSSGAKLGGAVRGLSPHAPYTVHPLLFEQIVELAAESRAPLAFHLAETRAELQLLREQKGELVDLLSELGVWRPGLIAPGTRPLDFLRCLAVVDHAVIAHGNYLNDEEVDFVSEHANIIVAYCPRTHAFFGHTHHPWRTLISRGAPVAIGTDGRGSNPDLSVWNELLYLRASAPDVEPATLLRMGTLCGAQALGLEAQLGTLEPGKLARLAVVQPGDLEAGDPYCQLLHPQSRVAGLITD